MKKLFALLLALAMLLALAACGAQDIQQAADILNEVAEVLSESEEAEAPAESPKEPAQAEEAEAPEEAAPEDAEEAPAADSAAEAQPEKEDEAGLPQVDKDGWYYDMEHVVAYLMTYGQLPSNYISKKDAEALGWQGGSVQKYKEGAAIGGSRFGNYEGLLPDTEGVRYTECDIDTDGASSRGAKRVIFSSDGHYYYTDDHYKSFREVRFEKGEWVLSDVS